MRFSWYLLRRLFRKAVSLVWESRRTKSCTPTLSRAIRAPSMFASVLSSTSFYNTKVVWNRFRRHQLEALRVSKSFPIPQHQINLAWVMPGDYYPSCYWHLPQRWQFHTRWVCHPTALQSRCLRLTTVIQEEDQSFQAAFTNITVVWDKPNSKDAVMIWDTSLTQSRPSSCKHKVGS